jgi:hypothetical protein
VRPGLSARSARRSIQAPVMRSTLERATLMFAAGSRSILNRTATATFSVTALKEMGRSHLSRACRLTQLRQMESSS